MTIFKAIMKSWVTMHFADSLLILPPIRFFNNYKTGGIIKIDEVEYGRHRLQMYFLIFRFDINYYLIFG